ncbi:MAG: ExbD/TolR family protein [Myxococcota bacterium]
MAAEAGGDPEDGLIASINVTPFVDVVLVLLIVLMVTSTEIVRAQLLVDLPKAASGGDAVPSTLNLVLTRDERLLLDGSPLAIDDLAGEVARLRRSEPDLQAVIAADQGVPYGRVIELIDIVKVNGVNRFALNIERVDPP